MTTGPSSPNSSEVRILKATLNQVVAQGEIFGLIFYRQLFTENPSLRSLFHTSLTLQTKKLLDSLQHTVAAFEEPERLMPTLEALGRRHVVYGVQEAHYDLVIRVLLHAFEQALGAEFSQEARESWRKALEIVAAAMKRGAALRGGSIEEGAVH